MRPSTRPLEYLFALMIALPVCNLWSQEAALPAQKSLASTLNVMVFPGQGQAPEQQSQDEAECYQWAVNNTGTDPFELSKQAEMQAAQVEQQKAQVAQAGKGAGLKGAAVGAGTGAVVGKIASDDAGKGAAYGAVGGAVVARSAARRGKREANQQIEEQSQQMQQANAAQKDTFNKAFAACLEAKSYVVKF